MNIEIKPSLIHGLGAFATKDFKKEEVIGIYEGMVMAGDSRGNGYFFSMEDDPATEKAKQPPWGILGTGLLRYINASSGHLQPNVYAWGVWIYAGVPIREGEELLMDYELEKD